MPIDGGAGGGDGMGAQQRLAAMLPPCALLHGAPITTSRPFGSAWRGDGLADGWPSKVALRWH